MKTSLIFILLVLISGFQTTMAQQTVIGIVAGNDNVPLPGATVLMEDYPARMITGDDGRFTIRNIKNQPLRITVKHLGYETFSDVIVPVPGKEIRITLNRRPFLSEEVVVSATRAGTGQGMAVSSMNKEEISRMNTGQDMPYLLQLLPSVLVTSDAGNGVGYTGIKMRGSDASRINITINGIPLNDAESQLVYWVNMPDFASSVENIEVQRGAGTSTNGAGAFGGTINILTENTSDTAFATVTTGAGSFNTFRNNVRFGTGLINKHFSLEGRLSRITSDGYIDRASSDLQSHFLSASYRDEKNHLRLHYFSGKETTYQSWYGVPESRVNNDLAGMLAYSDRNFLPDEERDRLLSSGRNYNFYTYDNQTDNYRQDHYQLIWSRALNHNWLMSLALHGTTGAGYYEEFKPDEPLVDYGITSTDTNITDTDIIRRRWLDNILAGATWSLRGQPAQNLIVTFGGAANRYEGAHFGEVIWAGYAGNSSIRDRYYDNDAVKTDANSYIKAEWSALKKLQLYGDLQLRRVVYQFSGPDGNGNPVPQNDEMYFFNPKAGVTWNPNGNTMVYASVAVAHKEPNRDDYTESSNASRPSPEKLVDYEAGLRWNNRTFIAAAGIYYMDYFNQLILTGEINDVGSYTRTNISRSYRAGIELEGTARISRRFSIAANATLSDNRIRRFRQFTDIYDNDFNYTGQQEETFDNTPIAFSPSAIFNTSLIYRPKTGLELQLQVKSVSKQYMDNTGNDGRILPAYSVCDIRVHWEPQGRIMNRCSFDLLVNNILDAAYSSNGYTYGYNYGMSRIQENFLYPQAGINFMGQMTVRF